MDQINKKRQDRRRRGSVLALVAMVVVIVAILGLVMISLGSTARVRAARLTTDTAARAAADAGLTEAIRLMNRKLTAEAVWDNSSLPTAANLSLPGVEATYSYSITGDKTSGFAVTSIGRSAFSERRVHTRLSINSLWFGIGVKENADILSKTTFATIPAGGDFTIRTNSTADRAISLYPNTLVPGDILVGPGGDPETAISTKSSSIINGDTYAAAEELQFPDVVVPPLVYKGALPAPDPMDPNLIRLTAADSGIYDEIRLSAGQKLHIVDGEVTIHVTGDIRLHNSAELLIMDNVSGPVLNMYLSGDLQADYGSFVVTENHIDNGTKLKIYGTETCDSIIFMNSGDLSAAVYAPDAHMEIKNSAAAYGSFTGESLEMKNSGEFYFDTRLLDMSIEDDLAYLAARWWEE
jgi:hypothetical protein